MPKQKTCRYDSSLGLLTKKFVSLMEEGLKSSAKEVPLLQETIKHTPTTQASSRCCSIPDRVQGPDFMRAWKVRGQAPSCGDERGRVR